MKQVNQAVKAANNGANQAVRSTKRVAKKVHRTAQKSVAKDTFNCPNPLYYADKALDTARDGVGFVASAIGSVFSWTGKTISTRK